MKTRRESRGLLESSMDQMNFRPRAIADLASNPDVPPDHLPEAVNFRTLHRNDWV